MVIFLAYLILFYFFHSLLAANSTKSFLHRFGLSPNYYRLFYNTLSVLLLVVGIVVYGNGEKTMILAVNNLTKVIGILTLIIGAVIVISALRNYNLAEFLGTQQLKKKPQSATEQLVTNGMNKWVRHPLYLGTIIFLLGVFLLQPNDLLLSLLIVTIIYVFVGAYLEEKKLIVQFGEAYLKYQSEVPMIFPKLW